MIWQIPDTQHELLWDYGMCADTSRGAAIRELINRALKGALAPAQQKVPSLPLPLLFKKYYLNLIHKHLDRLFSPFWCRL